MLTSPEIPEQTTIDNEQYIFLNITRNPVVYLDLIVISGIAAGQSPIPKLILGPTLPLPGTDPFPASQHP
jgi:hypothetical protein